MDWKNEISRNSPEKLNNNDLLEKKINQLIYDYLKNYSNKKETLKKLTKFETSKWLEDFKKDIQKLQNSGELKKDINIEKLFNDLKLVKNKIKEISQKQRENLKKQIENNFSPNKKYDLAEKIKIKNPKLYQSIIYPKWFKQHIISAWFWLGNSLYKTWIW